MHILNPAFPIVGNLGARSRSLIVASAFALLCASPASILAGPDHGTTGVADTVAQNVDYIGPETGATLELGFPVLVPSWVPGPFGGSPSVDAGGGYYSLYWMNAGGEPTFLQVTGQVGGALPAGSPYDLNVQLFINANVQGYGAIHDVTPAYDTVWWIAAGVLYKVESRNSSTDSVTLANSLITFVPPSAPEPETEPEPEPQPTSPPPVVEEPDPVTSAPGSNSGGSPSLPADDGATTDQVLNDTAAGDTADDTASDESTDTPDPARADVEAVDENQTADETPVVASDGTGQTLYSSDGTGGAQNLVIGSDGTGGTIEVIIPRQPTGQPTP
ncbi:MAG: hypothetical protein H0T93_04165 [Chloroflexia bacterium]|nr:hypothetical protein [Chloroflexia bacterium]